MRSPVLGLHVLDSLGEVEIVLSKILVDAEVLYRLTKTDLPSLGREVMDPGELINGHPYAPKVFRGPDDLLARMSHPDSPLLDAALTERSDVTGAASVELAQLC